MNRMSRVRLRWIVCFVLLMARQAAAQQTCSDMCGIIADVDLTFSRQFTGGYRAGEPYDVVTIHPDGTGDSLEDVGITLRVRPLCECFPPRPVPGIPAEQIILYSSSSCGCEIAVMQASRPTDAEGWTEFHGTMRGGGCVQSLTLFVDGVAAAIIPIKINSPDAVPASPCAVDAGDLSALAARLGIPTNYSICSDFNEDGAVDAADLSAFAAALGAACN